MQVWILCYWLQSGTFCLKLLESNIEEEVYNMTLMYNSVEYSLCIVVEILLKSFVLIMAVLKWCDY